MEFNFVDSSPQAVQQAKKNGGNIAKIYPFDQLEVGKSFTVKTADVNWKSLRVVCSQRSKNGKQYVFVKHDDLGLCEVARTA